MFFCLPSWQVKGRSLTYFYQLNETQAAEDEHRVLGPGDLASHIRETDVAVERSSKRIRSSSIGSEEVTIAQRLEVPKKELTAINSCAFMRGTVLRVRQKCVSSRF